MLSQEVYAPLKTLPETLSGTQPEIASEILPETPRGRAGETTAITRKRTVGIS